MSGSRLEDYDFGTEYLFV